MGGLSHAVLPAADLNCDAAKKFVDTWPVFWSWFW